MERKLIKQGGGGYTIYLPKRWIDKKSLKNGDTVNVEEKGTSIIIDTEIKDNKSTEMEVDSNNADQLQTIITHLYRSGFNKIILKKINKTILKDVKNIVKRTLLGFEVTEYSDNSCTLENISEPEDSKYEVILRKVFLIIKEDHDLIFEDLISGDYLNETEIQESKIMQDKYILFCRRLLSKEKYGNKITLEWEMLTFLMHVHHAYFYLYDYAKKNNIKISSLENYSKKLKEYFILFEKAYYEKETDYIIKINNLKTKYQFGEIISEIEGKKGKQAVVFSYVREIFRLIQIGTSPILSLNLLDNINEKD